MPQGNGSLSQSINIVHIYPGTHWPDADRDELRGAAINCVTHFQVGNKHPHGWVQQTRSSVDAGKPANCCVRSGDDSRTLRLYNMFSGWRGETVKKIWMKAFNLKGGGWKMSWGCWISWTPGLPEMQMNYWVVVGADVITLHLSLFPKSILLTGWGFLSTVPPNPPAQITAALTAERN